MYQGWYGIGAERPHAARRRLQLDFTLGTGLTDPWANGATSIIYTGEKDPALWPRLIAQHRRDAVCRGAGRLPADPEIRRSPRRDDLGVLRHGLMAGEAPPPGLFDEWDVRTGRPLYEALGMSEISTYVSLGAGRAAQSRAPSARRSRAAASPCCRSTAATIRCLPARRPARRAPLRPGLMLGYWRPGGARGLSGRLVRWRRYRCHRPRGLRAPSRPRQRPHESARLSNT